MSDPSTIRILSLNGGGTRGYTSLVFLQRFLQQWGMTGTIAQNFDVISGTSIGGISALGFGLGKTVEDLIPFFTQEGQWVFTIRTAEDVIEGSINASEPSNRPNLAQKIAILGDNDWFYQATDPASNYGSSHLKAVLQGIAGTSTLADMQTNVLIPSLQTTTTKAVFFSNVNYSNFIGQNELAVNVALATSAAPTYFAPISFNGHTYIDGGIYQNSPAQLGLTLAKTIKPTAKRACLLQLGTGTNPDHDISDPFGTVPFVGTAKSLADTFGAAIPAVTRAGDTDLFLRNQYTLERLFYYSYAPVLDSENQDTDLDNTDPSFFTYLASVANNWYDNDLANITNFIGHLNA